jgi:chromosome segregation ATPase
MNQTSSDVYSGEARIQELEAQLEQAQITLVRERQQVDSLAHAVGSTEQKAAALIAETQVLKGVLTSGNSQLEATHRELENSRLQVEQLTHVIRRQEERVSALEADTGTLERVVMDKESQLEATHRELENRRLQIEQLTHVIRRHEERVSTLEAETDALKRVAMERESQLAATQTELGHRLGHVEKLTRVIGDRERKIAELTEAMSSASRGIRQLEQRVGEQAEALRAAQIAEGILRNEVTERREHATAVAAECALLRQSALRRDAEVALLEESAAKKSAIIDSLDANLRALQRKVWSALHASKHDSAPPSREPEEGAAVLHWLLSRDGAEFVEVAYRTLLRRAPDVDGQQHYWWRLRAGLPKLRILEELADSAEGRQINSLVPGLKSAIRLQRLARIPILGSIIAAVLDLESMAPVPTRVRALQQQLADAPSSFGLHLEYIRQDVQLMCELSCRGTMQPDVAMQVLPSHEK